MSKASKAEKAQWKAQQAERDRKTRARQARELEAARQRNIQRAGGKENAAAVAAVVI